MQFVLVTGTTATARIDGLSAAGASPSLLAHTPAADASVLVEGVPPESGVIPVSPTGCPTPAVISRAGRELLSFDVAVVDGGSIHPVHSADRTLSTDPGRDIREPVAVTDVGDRLAAARDFGKSIPDDHVVLAESVPGGTTTALATLAALGERPAVSSSLATNPIDTKRAVAAAGLNVSGLPTEGLTETPVPTDSSAAPDMSGNASTTTDSDSAAVESDDEFSNQDSPDPIRVLRSVGDPALVGVVGVALGVLDRGGRVTFAGGTQLCAAAALIRSFEMTDYLQLATTAFVAADEHADVEGLTDSLDVDLTVTDPRFDEVAHPMTDAYCRGEAKEGVGMGGVLAMADGAVPGINTDESVSVADVRDRALDVYDRLLAAAPADHPAHERSDLSY